MRVRFRRRYYVPGYSMAVQIARLETICLPRQMQQIRKWEIQSLRR